jgi:type II secretion system protein N
MSVFMSFFRSLRWKEIARNAGISLGFFLLFTYLTFPWDAVRQRLEADLSLSLSSPQSAAQVVIGGMHSSWFTGVVLDRVLLSRQDPATGAPRAALLPELRLRVSLWSLLRGQKSVSFAAKAMGGQLSGDLFDSKQLSSLTLNGTGLQLADTKDLLGFFGIASGLDFGGLDLQGTTTVKGDMSFKPNDLLSLKAHLDVAVDHAMLKGGSVAEIDLPEVDLGKIELLAHAQEGRFDVDRFKIDSPDVSVESDGVFITLNQNLGYSLPHGKIRVHVGDELQKRIPYLGMGLSALKAPDRDGYYSLPLGGSLRSPRIM